MSPDERVRRCLQYADESTALANLATHHELRGKYLTIAGEWLKLAGEIERFTD